MVSSMSPIMTLHDFRRRSCAKLRFIPDPAPVTLGSALVYCSEKSMGLSYYRGFSIHIHGLSLHWRRRKGSQSRTRKSWPCTWLQSSGHTRTNPEHGDLSSLSKLHRKRCQKEPTAIAISASIYTSLPLEAQKPLSIRASAQSQYVVPCPPYRLQVSGLLRTPGSAPVPHITVPAKPSLCCCYYNIRGNHSGLPNRCCIE